VNRACAGSCYELGEHMLRLPRGLVHKGAIVTGGCLLAASSGCSPLSPLDSSDDTTTAVSYVGTAAGTDAIVGALVGRGEIDLYVCGGAATVTMLTAWLYGSVAEGDQLSASDEGWSATGTVGAEAIDGVLVTPAGKDMPFSAQRVVEETIAGVYGTIDSACRTGVIISQGSVEEEPTMQGSWCDESGIREQVIPILPIANGPEGVAVGITQPQGMSTLFVQRVTHTR